MIDNERMLESLKKWNRFSQGYYDLFNRSTQSVMSSLISLSRLHSKTRILDAGCGPGIGTSLIAHSIPNHDSTVYAFDFSPEMVKYCKEVFERNDDFNANVNNYWELTSYAPSDQIILEKDLDEIRKKKSGKVIKFFEGNAEKLVFADRQFDAYISNLCWMLCDGEKAMEEAYRVLKPGGVLSVSIWGKKEDTKFAFKIFEEAFLRHGLMPKEGGSSYDFSKDPDLLKQKLEEIGFKNVKMNYSNVYFDCFNVDDYMEKFIIPVNPVLEKLDEEKANLILNEVKNEVKEKLIGSHEVPRLNTMIITAFKQG